MSFIEITTVINNIFINIFHFYFMLDLKFFDISVDLSFVGSLDTSITFDSLPKWSYFKKNFLLYFLLVLLYN